MIETLDGALGACHRPAIVCVTGDHATPAPPDVIHSGDRFPSSFRPGSARRPRERVRRVDLRRGDARHLRGPDLMPVLLNAADRPLFLGSRPTPFDGADGYPAILDPL